MTDNHNYNTPAEGSTDWHTPLNDNFTNLDSDVEIRDVESNLSDYSPKANAKFFATDSGRVFVGDGTDWNPVGKIPQIPGDVYVQSTEPTNPNEDDLWIDTS